MGYVALNMKVDGD